MSNHGSDNASMMVKVHQWWDTNLRGAVVDSSVIGLFGLELGKFLFEEHADGASRATMITRLTSASVHAVWSLIS